MFSEGGTATFHQESCCSRVQDLASVDWKKVTQIYFIQELNQDLILYLFICNKTWGPKELQDQHATWFLWFKRPNDSLLWLKSNIRTTLLKGRKVAVSCSSISLSFCLQADQLSYRCLLNAYLLLTKTRRRKKPPKTQRTNQQTKTNRLGPGLSY